VLEEQDRPLLRLGYRGLEHVEIRQVRQVFH
jgi:hypothetical protein